MTGGCTSCYNGYKIVNEECKIITENDQNQVKDKYCKKFIENSNFCEECYQGYFVSDGSCKVNNPLCKTID